MQRPEETGFPSKQQTRQCPALKGVTNGQREEVYRLARDYLKFLRKALTPPTTVDEVLGLVSTKGYKNKPNKNEPFYIVGPDDKSFALVKPGNLKNGLRVIVSHVDSPCLIAKQRPIVFNWDPDEKELYLGAMLSTYCYGGIQPYQWDSLIVKIMGTGVKSGRRYEKVVDGLITGHSAHLDLRTDDTPMGEGFSKEDIKVFIGSFSKKELLDTLHLKDEEDFFSTMWYAVPKISPTFIGTDILAGYGHDDRAGTFAAVNALLKARKNDNACLVIGFDYEESFSAGAGGANGAFFKEIITKVKRTLHSNLTIDDLLNISQGISADVDVASGVHENDKSKIDIKNIARIGYGVCITSATGLDDNNNVPLDYKYHIKQLSQRNKIRAQFLGTGDHSDRAQGSLTAGKFLTDKGLYCIDAGPAIGGSHGITETLHVADLYWSRELYKAFFESAMPYRKIHKKRL